MAKRLKAKSRPLPNGCIVWTGAHHHYGYGWIRIRNKTELTHRVAYEVATGETLPKGSVVYHVCDNPPCINPDHLRRGTHADNVADKVEKKRHRYGEAHHNARLTETDVRRIRSMLGSMSQGAIANHFSVDRSVISRISTGRAWKHVA